MNSPIQMPVAGPSGHLTNLRFMLGMFSPRIWLIALAGAVGTAILLAIPAALIENPVFGREVAPRAQDYVFLAITALIGGLIIASFAVTPMGGSEGSATAGGFLSFLAVGCPVCNKLVVAAIGTSGALSFFAPAQLFLGFAAVALLAWSLLLRARAVVGTCSP